MLDIKRAKDEEILKEVEKIQYLYGLKYEIRYDLAREEKLHTESVAEHIYGMFILAHYFLPLEDPEGAWDHKRIYELILWHDIDEIEAGDLIGYKKTTADRIREKQAEKEVLAKMPTILQSSVSGYLAEYTARITKEAQFVKAIDKMEPNFHLLNPRGKQIMHNNGTTLEEHNKIKTPYIKGFLVLERFNEVMAKEMVRQGFFQT